MNVRRSRTLLAVFERPTRADLSWREIESLLRALGAALSEGRGSRIRVVLGGRAAVFHRPHPQRVLSKPAVSSVRSFLRRAGIHP